MNQSPRRGIYLAAAVLLGVAPVVYGLLRLLSFRHDYRGLWMALAASVFATGVLAASIGRRRSRHAALTQSLIILVISTLVAGVAGFISGATAAAGIWAVAFVMGACVAASSLLIGLARATPAEKV